jgi:hypothetical protein
MNSNINFNELWQSKKQESLTKKICCREINSKIQFKRLIITNLYIITFLLFSYLGVPSTTNDYNKNRYYINYFGNVCNFVMHTTKVLHFQKNNQHTK